MGLSIDPTVFAKFTLPLLVFIAEACVITLATLRTIFIGKGMKGSAALLGFFEVTIWLFAIGAVMHNLERLDCCLAFALGFSLGNYLGVTIERMLALGNVIVHVTTMKDTGDLIEDLKAAGYGTTAQDGFGAREAVQVVFSVIQRKDLSKVIALVMRFDPKAFYWVHELQVAAAGVFPRARPAMPSFSNLVAPSGSRLLRRPYSN